MSPQSAVPFIFVPFQALAASRTQPLPGDVSQVPEGSGLKALGGVHQDWASLVSFL